MFTINGIKYNTAPEAFNEIKPNTTLRALYMCIIRKKRKGVEIPDITNYIEYVNNKEPLVYEYKGVKASLFQHCELLNRNSSAVSIMASKFFSGDIIKALNNRDTRGVYNSSNLLNKKELSRSKVKIYFIRFNLDGETYYKYGITKREIYQRFQGLRVYIFAIKETTLKRAVDYEKEMFYTFESKKRIPADDFVGKTEVLYKLTRQDIKKAKKILKKYWHTLIYMIYFIYSHKRRKRKWILKMKTIF